MFLKASFFSLAALCLLLFTACDNKPKSAPAKAVDAISIINPHIRALPPGQKVTAMYMQLKNSSASDHELIRIEGDISNMIELHSHTNDNGVMRMGQVESIPVHADSTAHAKPGGYHVMIMGLTKDPKLGEKFNFNFIFKDGSTIPVTAEVKKMDMHSH